MTCLKLRMVNKSANSYWIGQKYCKRYINVQIASLEDEKTEF